MNMGRMILTDKHSQDTFEDEDPSPSAQTTNALHLHDATSKEATKGTCSSGSREEDGDSQTTFVTLIPQCDAIDVGEYFLPERKGGGGIY